MFNIQSFVRNFLFLICFIFSLPMWAIQDAGQFMSSTSFGPFKKHFSSNLATGTQDEIVFNNNLGDNLNFTITYGPNAITVNASTPNDFSNLDGTLPSGRITFTVISNGSTHRLIITVTNVSERVYENIKIDVIENESQGMMEGTYTIVIRRPFNLAFALDESGSMECDTDPINWPTCAADFASGTARWQRLKDGMQEAIARLNDPNFLLPNDRLSMVFFSGNSRTIGPLSTPESVSYYATPITCMTIAGNPTVPRIFCELSQIENNIPSFPGTPLARDGTSVGDGILTAITNGLDPVPTDAVFAGDPNFLQAILLFSDGEQNRASTVRIICPDGTDLDETDNNTTCPTVNRLIVNIPSGGSDVNLDDSNLEDIGLFVVGVSESPGFEHLMQRLSNVDNGYLGFSAITAGTTITDFISAGFLNGFLQDFSPKMIKREVKPLFENNQATFSANKNVGTLFLDAHFNDPIAPLFDYFVTYNGSQNDTIDELVEITVGNFYASAKLDFTKVPLQRFGSEGDWSLNVREKNLANPNPPLDSLISNTNPLSNQSGPTPPSIVLLGVADDEVTDFDVSLGADILKVGEPINLSATLGYKGQPIDSAVIKATIIRPGIDLSNFIATADVKFEFDPNSELEGCAAQKLAAIRQDPSINLDSLLSGVVDEIILTPDGNGQYSAIYNDVIVPGGYFVIFNAQVEIAGEGQLERTKEFTPVIQFGDLTVDESDITQIESADSNVVIFNINPKYTLNGKTFRLGLGFENILSVRGNGFSSATISDDCESGNGSYTITLVKDSPSTDPVITVSAFEDPVIENTPVSELLVPSTNPFEAGAFQVSVHGGVTFPFGSLENDFDRGFFAEVDLGYQITSTFGFDLVGGYYQFPSPQNAIDDFSILGSTLYARLALGGERFHTIGEIGMGLYSPEKEQGNWGWSGKISLTNSIGQNNRIIGLLSGTYFKLNDSYEFGTLGIGFIFNLNTP